jgi:aldehyde:ferredoxin oxidoreductase
MILMDDITGLCKFAKLSPETEAEALRIAVGLDITGDQLADVVMKTFLRGYANERRQGFDVDDYRLPSDAHGPMGESGLEVFNTPEFFAELRERVIEKLDRQAAEAGFPTA